MSGRVDNPRGRSALQLLLLLCMSCGGLAQDGPNSLPNRTIEEDAPMALPPLSAATTARSQVDSSESGASSSRASAAGASHVGEPCGHLEHDGSIIVGEVELQQDLRCQAGRSCLMHARKGRACPSGSDSTVACAETAEAPFVPVPPTLEPEADWQGGVCTCRCAGGAPDAENCVCPLGMSCRALIPSAGVNGAGGPYVGSYCAY